jgi:adenylate cyclase
MKHKQNIYLFLFILISSFLQSQKPTVDSCSILISNKFYQENQYLVLNKIWKFKIGDNKTWAANSFDDSQWESSTTRDFKNKKLQEKNPKDIVWFRNEICIDATAEFQPIALEFSSGAAMDIYWDGKFIKRFGKFSKDGEPKYINPTLPLIINGGSKGKHTLAVRYENIQPFNEQTISGFEISVSNPDQTVWTLSNQYIMRGFLIQGVAFIFFTLFLIHLLSFLFYRKERSNLLFSLFNLGMSVFLFAWFLSFETEDIKIGVQLGYISSIAGLFAAVFLSLMLNSLFGKVGLRFKILVGLSVVLSLLMIFPNINQDLDKPLFIIILVWVCLEAIFIIIRAIIRKIPGSRIMGTGMLFFLIVLITTVAYLIYTGGILLVNPWNSFGEMLIFVLFIMFIFSLPFTLSAFLAWRSANDNKNLNLQIEQVKNLSSEKQQILLNQNNLLENQVNERTHELQKEKKKTEDLLLNILPHEVAEELKENGSSEAKYYDEVTVLFTDFVNFTANSERIGVQEVLNELNICFTEFDSIMEKYNLEKIKTIGDAYLAVSGLPVSNDQHAKNAVNASLEILSYIQQRKKDNPNALDIRIGIHSGPIIAGIVGVKKFAYDIWGDTVNTAARMEQNSSSGKVNVSEATYQLIKDDFTFEHRGKIETKGKGAMEMYFVNQI